LSLCTNPFFKRLLCPLQMRDIVYYGVQTQASIIELCADADDHFPGVRFMLMSCLSFFMARTASGGMGLPRHEAICKLTFLDRCVVILG